MIFFIIGTIEIISAMIYICPCLVQLNKTQGGPTALQTA